MAVHHATGKRVANRARLLVDFLQHEIGETTLFSCGNIPINMRDGWVDFATFLVEILNRRLAVRKRELREGVVFEHDHIARLIDECHDVARDKRAGFALAHHDGRVFAGAHDDTRLGVAHNRDAIRASQAISRLAHGLEQIAVVGLFNQMGNDFGVGLAREHVSATDELFFERGIVLNDAIMHHGDIIRAGRMRVRVILARFAVGCPARMANAARAVDVHALNHGFKAGDLANLVLHVEAQRRLHGDARRIVAAVFHALQAANQNVLRLQASGVSNDAAHRENSFPYWECELDTTLHCSVGKAAEREVVTGCLHVRRVNGAKAKASGTLRYPSIVLPKRRAIQASRHRDRFARWHAARRYSAAEVRSDGVRDA